MKTVTIRLPDEIHIELKVKMAKEQKKLQEYVSGLIKKDMGKDTNDNKEKVQTQERKL
jgi:predicted HicB family RNase H-like nuclease